MCCVPIAIVYSVAEARSVNNREGKVDPVLLEHYFARLHGDCLLKSETWARMLAGVDVGEKQRIYHGGFAQTRFTCIKKSNFLGLVIEFFNMYFNFNY